MNMKRMLGIVASLFLMSAMASAQATRTWVSGVGDDANPCSRTAPCKTFAGAISKTAAGGEINALDSAGFGAVTITKSITISGEGLEAGVLVSGTNGVIINAAASDVIVLRGLDFEGLGTGINGIRFLAGGTLQVENCVINHFNNFGISFEPSGASVLSVRDTILRNNFGAAGGGVQLLPGPAGSASASFEGVTASHNRTGFLVQDRAKATIRNSTVSNGAFGFHVKSTSAAAELNVAQSQSVNHTAAGVRSEGALATLRLSDTSLFDNGSGIVSVGLGAVLSFGNNQIAGNTVNGAPTGILAQQ